MVVGSAVDIGKWISINVEFLLVKITAAANYGLAKHDSSVISYSTIHFYVSVFDLWQVICHFLFAVRLNLYACFCCSSLTVPSPFPIVTVSLVTPSTYLFVLHMLVLWRRIYTYSYACVEVQRHKF